MDKEVRDWLILVYPKGGSQPKEVWWLQNVADFQARKTKLANAGEEFIAFKAQVESMFHRHAGQEGETNG